MSQGRTFTDAEILARNVARLRNTPARFGYSSIDVSGEHYLWLAEQIERERKWKDGEYAQRIETLREARTLRIENGELAEAAEQLSQIQADMNAAQVATHQHGLGLSIGGRVAALITERRVLREALERVWTGGNHLGHYRTDDWPLPIASPETAGRQIIEGWQYDMWCCWRAMMLAREAVAKFHDIYTHE